METEAEEGGSTLEAAGGGMGSSGSLIVALNVSMYSH